MTYTVIARDAETGELGIGIATYSLAVGASCPYIRPGVGAVSTQAATYPAHGPTLLDMIETGLDPASAINSLRETDPGFEYRQIGLVTAQGESFVHTGPETRAWAGSLESDGCLVMGNVLAGEHVAGAISTAFTACRNEGLAGRLMASLEAGRDAGGQRGLQGRHLPERSAVIIVYREERFPAVDLRVDDHPDAVTDLRRVFDRFMKAADYYNDRAATPGSTPPQDSWMVEHGLD